MRCRALYNVDYFNAMGYKTHFLSSVVCHNFVCDQMSVKLLAMSLKFFEVKYPENNNFHFLVFIKINFYMFSVHDCLPYLVTLIW